MPNNEPKIGVLITNLGSPDEPDKKALKKYLKQFLSDKRVIQPIIPRWIWWLILHGIILNTRPKRSAKLYQSVWNSFGEGAPLLTITKKQLHRLKERFDHSTVEIEMAMRYGSPDIKLGIDKLLAKGIDQLIVLPLYPQYSRTTTESTFDIIHAIVKTHSNFPNLKLINDYYSHPGYINALKTSVEKHWQKHGKPQKLIISFHGIPQVYCDLGDVYPQHCYASAQLLVEALGLSTDDYMMCFQSRFGKLEWLKPYLDVTLRSLPSQNITDVQVVCPGFASDCLETLEEIEHENKQYFLESGGKKYSYIPALNDSEEHINCLEDIILSRIRTVKKND
ncbi:MAG: ferrochelatase [Alcanivoracaceae bacterium]|nr:ferrochelatase [Alcanivoracaceae bacterium]